MALKKYRIQKRFTLWLERTVEAESHEAALQVLKKMNADDFVKIRKATEVLDETLEDGTGVSECWD